MQLFVIIGPLYYIFFVVRDSEIIWSATNVFERFDVFAKHNAIYGIENIIRDLRRQRSFDVTREIMKIMIMCLILADLD